MSAPKNAMLYRVGGRRPTQCLPHPSRTDPNEKAGCWLGTTKQNAKQRRLSVPTHLSSVPHPLPLAFLFHCSRPDQHSSAALWRRAVCAVGWVYFRAGFGPTLSRLLCYVLKPQGRGGAGAAAFSEKAHPTLRFLLPFWTQQHSIRVAESLPGGALSIPRNVRC